MGDKMDYEKKWEAERERKAFLALADGTVFYGVAFGARRDALGEIVFNTGMCGYQEILTDPSYAGQFVALTAAEIGNYGINKDDVESRGLFLSGLVVNDLTPPSNWRSEKSLDEYLSENNIPGIYGVDVRALTIHIRDHGSQKAYLHVGECKIENGECRIEDWAINKAKEWTGLDGQDYAARVTTEVVYDFGRDEVEKLKSSIVESQASTTFQPFNLSTFQPRHERPRPLVVAYDFGVKTNILRSLASWARVAVVPAQTPAGDVLAMNPDGVFLSNGPADPAAVTYAIENIRKLLCSEWRSGGVEDSPTRNSPTHPLPIMGICLGHQLLSLACGAKTMRLKFGHHGCNHPVKNLATGHVEITSQNHNFAVDPATVPDCLEVTHVNLNDNSIEGVRHKTLPAFSVQYHPESCPGPHDSRYLFDQFKKMIYDNRQLTPDSGCRSPDVGCH